jgi:RHS repeat-associated protein
MSKTIGGTTTQFLYDRLNPVQELNGATPPAATANLLTGLNIDEYFTRTASGTTSTLLADALGATIGLVGASPSIATSYAYQPFGATTTGGAANTNPYQFTGRENDGTGLYFYRARYYSPTFQRFIAQDPIGFSGRSLNLYSYVFNNPSNFVDPSGELLGLPGWVTGGLEATLSTSNCKSAIALGMVLGIVGDELGVAAGEIVGAGAGFAAGEAVFPLGGGFPGAFAGGMTGLGVGQLAGSAAGITLGESLGELLPGCNEPDQPYEPDPPEWPWSQPIFFPPNIPAGPACAGH